MHSTIFNLFQKISFSLQLKPSVTFTLIIAQLANKANSTTRLKVSPLSYAKHFEFFISVNKHTLNRKNRDLSSRPKTFLFFKSNYNHYNILYIDIFLMIQ